MPLLTGGVQTDLRAHTVEHIEADDFVEVLHLRDGADAKDAPPDAQCLEIVKLFVKGALDQTRCAAASLFPSRFPQALVKRIA
jgi:hypothetical protein